MASFGKGCTTLVAAAVLAFGGSAGAQTGTGTSGTSGSHGSTGAPGSMQQGQTGSTDSSGTMGNKGTTGAQSSALNGRVSNVTEDSLTLQTDDGQLRQLRTDEETQINMNGQRVPSAASIPEGAQVRASFGLNGKVQSIDVVSSDTSGSTGSQGLPSPQGTGDSSGTSGCSGSPDTGSSGGQNTP